MDTNLDAGRFMASFTDAHLTFALPFFVVLAVTIQFILQMNRMIGANALSHETSCIRVVTVTGKWVSLIMAPSESRPMTDNTESLILEHLRAIRGKIDVMADDIGNIKMRLSAVESHVANLTAIFNSRLDTLEKRIERIERGLDLSSTPH